MTHAQEQIDWRTCNGIFDDGTQCGCKGDGMHWHGYVGERIRFNMSNKGSMYNGRGELTGRFKPHSLAEAKAMAPQVRDAILQRDRDLRRHRKAAAASMLRLYTWGADKFGLQRLVGICTTGGASTMIACAEDGQGASTWEAGIGWQHRAEPVEFRIGDHDGFDAWLKQHSPFYTKAELSEFAEQTAEFERNVAEWRARWEREAEADARATVTA